jgi:hypothetical protein
VVNVFLSSRRRDGFDRVRNVGTSEDERRIGRVDGFGSEVVDRRDQGFVSSVELFEDLLGERSLNVAEHRRDRLLSRSAVLDRHRSLKDRDTLRILIEDRFNIFRLPEGILLEPDGERSVENRDEGDGLTTIRKNTLFSSFSRRDEIV